MFNPVIMRALATAAANGAVGALVRNRRPQRRGLNDEQGWDDFAADYYYPADSYYDSWRSDGSSGGGGWDAAYVNDYYYLSDPWGGFDPYSAQGADSLTGSEQGIWNWSWETGQYDTPAFADDSAWDYSSGQYQPEIYSDAPIAWDQTSLDWLASGHDPSGAGIEPYWQSDGSGGFYDDVTGIYVDADGVAYDLYAPTGETLLQIDTTDLAPAADFNYGYGGEMPDVVIQPDNSVNLSDLGNTLDWWEQLAADPGAVAELTPVSLPAATYDAGYVLNTPSTTLASDPNAPAAVKAAPALKKPSTWDKIKAALATQAQKAASGASGSGSSAARPATTPPNAQGQCPTGYQKNPQTGQCQLIPRAATQQRPATVAPNAAGQCPPGYAKNAQGVCVLQNRGFSLQTILNNPLYLLLAVLGLILIAKK